VSKSFDSLLFSQSLQAAGFTREQADTLAELIRDQVVKGAATAVDLEGMETRLRERAERLEERFEHKIDKTEKSMTIKFGTMLVVAVGVLAAVIKLLQGKF
jgi:hypothetical protein